LEENPIFVFSIPFAIRLGTSKNRFSLIIALARLPAAQRVRCSVRVNLSVYSDARGREEFT
jgi:hypothetical protein